MAFPPHPAKDARTSAAIFILLWRDSIKLFISASSSQCKGVLSWLKGTYLEAA